MDILPSSGTQKRRFRIGIYALAFLASVVVVSFWFSRLKPSIPVVSRAGLWVGAVKRGDMTRVVHGTGTLVPRVVRVIPANAGGQVEEYRVQPGAKVRADEVILVLSNPDLEQSEKDAEWQLKGAQADYRSLKAQLQNQLLDRQSQAAMIHSEYLQAKLQADTNLQLYKLGLASNLVYELSCSKADELERQSDITTRETDTFAESIQAQLAGQEAKVAQLQAQVQSKQALIAQLHVKSGIDGVLQELSVEVGQQVSAGTVLARVAQPKNLKAQLKIAETQAKDIQLGQAASIDTHNGTVSGRVLRIAPAVENGTVTVDVTLPGELPPGARPDLSVDGAIEVEHLENVLYIDRPVHGDSDGTVGLFKLVDGGSEAVRVQVKLGFVSAERAEILRGLQEGDKLILSDVPAWRHYNRVRLTQGNG